MGWTPECQSEVEMNEWPLWEVFIRSQHGLAHKHVGSLHAPDAEMAIKNARDVYTRRNEGRQHLGGEVLGHRGQFARRQGTDVRAGVEQGVSPSDVLSDARRSQAHLKMRRSNGRCSNTCCGLPTAT